MKKFLTFKEAAEYLGITEDEFQNMVNKNKIPSYKIGGVYTRFKVDELSPYRCRSSNKTKQKGPSFISDRIKDFFYFNDFYIFSFIAIIVILYFIFR